MAIIGRNYIGDSLKFEHKMQLWNFCQVTDSYLPFSEIPFLVLLQKCIDTCCLRHKNIDETELSLSDFLKKYYPRGFKLNKKVLSDKKTNYVVNINTVRFKHRCSFPSPYNPIEMTAFVMTMRACYKWLISSHNEDDTNILIDRLNEIQRMVWEI